ncbi:MAG: DUF6456 domain-containing protein [Rhodobacteraceae bacterium]|nr:DUF6456 domain-containing protein [Paracoccaceae bacterium]
MMRDPAQGWADWLPQAAQTYLRHVVGRRSMRELARAEGCHPTTIMRRVRRIEERRDDPLVDGFLGAIEGRTQKTETEGRRQDAPAGRAEETVMTVTLRGGTVAQDEDDSERAVRRALRRLCETGAVLAVAPGLDRAVVMKANVRTAVVDRSVAEILAMRDWIAVSHRGRVTTHVATSAGRAALRRMLCEEAGGGEAEAAFAEQHRDWEEREVDEAPRPRRMRFNIAESPLTALARHRDREGRPFLSPELVAAGERLREDFELAQIGPRVAQNWERFLTGGDRGDFAGGRPDAGSSSARERVAAALRELGPGLGDMALRCCCFLEGLEQAERRLGWSARSGKIVLRIALMRLKRHYDGVNGGRAPLIG